MKAPPEIAEIAAKISRIYGVATTVEKTGEKWVILWHGDGTKVMPSLVDGIWLRRVTDALL